jgi:hypothetical protein
MLLLEWLWYWHVNELSVVLFSNYFASATWTWFVITMWTPMYVSYLWTIFEMGCNMWLVMLNHVRSWLYVSDFKSFVVSSDYRVYMGSGMTVWSLRWLVLYLCSYKLDGSVAAGIGARFNIKLVICEFKTKVFVLQNQFLTTYSYIYRFV